MKRSRNTQMFALPEPPPARVILPGGGYRLLRVFKHDFFAATCLYELDRAMEISPGAMEKVVVKFGRTQPFCGLPMDWMASFMQKHEEGIYRALASVNGVPRWAGRLGSTAYAIEYIDALPLDHFPKPPAGFFDRLRKVFDDIHAAGVAYCDANKRSNILVDADGRPFLVDFQISFRRRDDLPWPLGQIVAAAVEYVGRKDLYHLYKHKRRLSPDELTSEEDELSRHRGGWHGVHRKLTKHWRNFRRGFLHGQFEKGRLVSPTAELEDHAQPEKETWRRE
jgi:hypothetical protein